jgi:DNA-binding transcriptional regulator LsrR (DeoR family)
MEMRRDIVRDFELLALERKPATVEEWRALTQELRQKWGGERVYVAKDAPAGKVQRLADYLAAGLPLAEASRRLGVSRWTVHRYLRRPWATDY